jgi:hypothetical protein
MKGKINSEIIALMLVVGSLFYVFMGKDRGNYYGDAMGYYSYLPSAIIYGTLKEPKDLPQGTVLSPGRSKVRDYLSRILVSPKGYLMNQYTYGIALMESPFFLLAHAYEKVRGLPADGFDDIYNFSIQLATLFYAVLGLYILFLCLKRFFDKTSALLGLCIIALGTNYLWFATLQAGMAHINIFFLVSSLLYYTIRAHESPRFRYFSGAALSLGMIALIRPTDALFITIPLLYNVYSINTLKEKLRFLYAHKGKIVLAALLAVPLVIPQLLYWKELTGHYLFYSYGENQGFNWKHPRIYEGLFSYKNGWLVYCPVMILSIIGMLWVKKLKPFFLIIVCSVPLFIYIIYAWYCYNYINGLGSRPMINISPLLAFPLVALISSALRQNRFVLFGFTVVAVFLSAISVSYCMQQEKGILWSENSTKTFNLNMLFRYTMHYEDIVTYDNEIIQPDKSKLSFLRVLDSEDFEHFDNRNVTFDTFNRSKYYHLQNGDEYPEVALDIKYEAEAFKDGKWLKLGGRFNAPAYSGFYDNHMLVLEIKSDTGLYYWKGTVINNKIGLADQPLPEGGFTLFDVRQYIWGEVYFFAPLPAQIRNGDMIHAHIWSLGRRDLLIDDFKIELYR